MYQLYHRKLPQKFYASLSELTEIHNHNIRNTKLFTYFIPCINKNFNKNLLFYRGSIVWDQLDTEFKGLKSVSIQFNLIQFNFICNQSITFRSSY